MRLNNRSRVKGDFYARICERLRGKFLGSTRLLMYAEALNENGKTVEASSILNKVRRRGFGYQSTDTSPVDLSTTDKAVFRDKVLQERRVELAFECHRWFDLIRTGRAVELMKSKGFKVNDTQLVCPIPQKQVDINPNIMIQNEYRID